MSRVALITGGTRGIGAAISKHLLAAKGIQVIAIYGENKEAAGKFQNETGIPILQCDVSKYEACAEIVIHVRNTWGEIDILVNNAGITRDAMLHKMTLDQWQEVLNTNLNSVFNMCHQVVPSMREKGFGRIVNISSINGLKGQVGQTNYSAAKAGILGFTKALALEVASKGVTVNAIAPGYIATEMVNQVLPEVLEKIIAQIPVGRLGTPEEIARCVAFLVAEEAGFITGATFSVNGGQYLV